MKQINNYLKTMTMPKFTDLMHNISGAIMLTGQTLISAFFVVIILVLVLMVEIQRVAHGIQLFEQSPNLAYLGAFVLVMMLLTLEFVVHYVETKSGYHQELKSEYSLKILATRCAYFLGFDKDWKPRHKSPAHAIKSYSRLLTLTILALALGGSMSDALGSVSGNWWQGLQEIAIESSLLEIVEWTGGLLFALALVVGAQRLTAYVAQRASETLSQSSSDVSNQDIADTSDCEPTDYQIDDDFEPLPIFEPVETIDLTGVDTNDDDTEPVIFDDSVLEDDYEPLPMFEPENVVDDGIVRQVVELGHVETCPDCGETCTPKKTKADAKRAIAAHRRGKRCKSLSQAVQS